ncbi:MAG: glycosyltransferase, partial [Actinobacteria bacterium]|nr:glycosyltransferase [Actinomycetota bacterium]
MIALSWAGFSTWLALPWISDLAEMITLPLAIFVVTGLAVIPGYLTAYLIATLLLDRSRELPFPPAPSDWPGLTLIIAAFNEEDQIEETVNYALASDYLGELEIIVANDGSTDQTAAIVERLAASNRAVTLLEVEHGGKALALNQALATVTTKLVATIDADTLL